MANEYRFDFGVEEEEMNVLENIRDVQVKTECCQLTKDESEFLLCQSLKKSLICTGKFNQSFDAKRAAKEKIQFEEASLCNSVFKAVIERRKGVETSMLEGKTAAEILVL